MQHTQQGVDGNIYYTLNGNSYQSILSGSIKPNDTFTIPSNFINKPGSYFLRIIAKDKAGTIIGEVQKQIEYYEFTNDARLLSRP